MGNTSTTISKTSRRSGKYIYRFFCAVILSAIAGGSFFYCWYHFVEDNNNTGFLLGAGNLGMALGIYVILYVIIGRWLHAFTIGVERKANVLGGQVLAIAMTDFFEVFISCAITGQFRYFWEFVGLYLLMFIVQAIVNCFLVLPMVNLYRHAFPPLRLIEVYSERSDAFWKKISSIAYKYDVTEQISCTVSDAELEERFKEFDAVLLNDLNDENRNRILKICFECDKRVYYVPKISDILVKGSEELNLFDTPLFLNRNNGMSPFQRWVKRFFDIVLCSIALIVLSPLFLLTALAIKLEDHGPVFYRQERVTQYGRHFMILKFRSMIVDAEKDGKSHPAGEKDDRITKVGHIIRACRVDELPQLLNIIKGDMSIVGPRPERWEHVEKYTHDIPEFEYREKVKGGLTGYAQVYGKYNTTALDKLKLDLFYVVNYSLLLDIQIILQTVKILVQKESTEGFTEEAGKELHDAEVQDHSKDMN